MEAKEHDQTSFLTLTYDDEHLPDGATLVPRDLQLFIKRLRRATSVPLRYFGVGEYGEESERPHYHVALFGHTDADIHHVWGKGMVHAGDLTRESAQYICGYTVKKLTNGRDERVRAWLGSREPEFARMSQGIGKAFADRLGDQMATEKYGHELIQAGDVPSVLKHEGRSFPLGRYLKARIRKAAGLHEPACKVARQVHAQVSQAVERQKLVETGMSHSAAFDAQAARQKQKVVNAESRLKLQQQNRRTL